MVEFLGQLLPKEFRGQVLIHRKVVLLSQTITERGRLESRKSQQEFGLLQLPALLFEF